MNARFTALLGLPLLAGCGFAYGAGVDVAHDGGYYEPAPAYDYGGAYVDHEYARRVDFRRLPIPRGHVPAAGRCRVWLPGVPPGRQPRSGSCRALEPRVPPGGWLLVRPARYPSVVEVIAYDAYGPRRTRYVYDVRTGRRVNPVRY